jgi:hypothetical protein
MTLEPVHEIDGSVELMRDTSAAQWIEERLTWWEGDVLRVSAIVPQGFEAYGRILHPAQRDLQDGGTRVRWSTIALSTGRVVHPEMQFDRIAALRKWSDDPGWDAPPGEGLLPREDCERLASLLRRHTSTPKVCWFCVWEGYGGFFDAKRYGDVPRVTTPGRAYVLYRGPLEAVTSFRWGLSWQSPNLWWPDDRAWCVATEIDLPETYVGGSPACIERILADDQLEAIQTRLDARVDFDADTLNPSTGVTPDWRRP